MWDTMKATQRKYFFSSFTKPGRWESDNQSALVPVYSDIFSPNKTAPTALAIPTEKPIFTHSELLQSIKERISRFNLPPDPAGRNKENHPLFRMGRSPRIPTLFYLSEDSGLDDAATGDPVLSQLAIGLSDSYNEYISNRRSEYEVGYPDEANIAQERNKPLEIVQFHHEERPLKREPSLSTALEAEINIPAERQPASSPNAPGDSSGSYKLLQAHRRMGSVNPPIRRTQSARYLDEKAQTRRLMAKSESLSITSSTKTLPKNWCNQTSASHYGLPTNNLQVLGHQRVLSSPPGPIQTLQENPDQTSHPRHTSISAPSTEGEEPPTTMAQTLACRRERVIAMSGFPAPPLMSNSPPHLNTPPPSSNLPPPSPLIPCLACTLQTPDTHPTFKVPRKPLPPSALRNLSRQVNSLEAIQSLTKEDFKSPEQAKISPESLLAPLPRSASALSLSSMRSSISGRSV